MKKLSGLIFAAALAVAARAADAVPHFNATLTIGKEHRFVLVSAAGKTSPFLHIGESFEGYTIKAYDAKTSTLDLEHDGKIAHVTLDADAAVGNAPTVTHATVADAEAIMNKIHIEDLLERSIAQQKKMFMTQIDRIGTNFPNADKEDLAAFQKKIVAEFEAALDVGTMKADITRIYSETFSKEELDGISAFYDTPLGQTLLAKQPEVQQKMQAAMLPRVGQLGPKIQEMAKEFAMGQKAKMEAAGGASAAPPAGKP